MFNLFKRKSNIDLLNSQYKKLLAQAHKLSTTNRKASDDKYAEADKIAKEIEKIQNLSK